MCRRLTLEMAISTRSCSKAANSVIGAFFWLTYGDSTIDAVNVYIARGRLDVPRNVN